MCASVRNNGDHGKLNMHRAEIKQVGQQSSAPSSFSGLAVFHTFTFGAFGRCFHPKRLTKSTFVDGDSNISL